MQQPPAGFGKIIKKRNICTPFFKYYVQNINQSNNNECVQTHCICRYKKIISQ